MTTGQRKDILCDLCEDEQALSFCGECMFKLGDFCKVAHTSQKQTKDHSLAEIESVKLLYLNVSCSLCNGLSEKFCQECDACLCTKCADSHHQLSDVQTSTAHINSLQREDNLTSHSHNDSTNNIHDSPVKQPEVCGKYASRVCDLCDEEHATMYCDECQLKLGDFCQLAHTKRKLTKSHHLTSIPDSFNVPCSSWDEFAEKFCSECGVHLCSQCAGNHHKLGETLASTTDKPWSGGQDKKQPILDDTNIDFTFQMRNSENQCSGKKPFSYGQETNITDLGTIEQNSDECSSGKKHSLNRMTFPQQSQRRTNQLPLTASESGVKNSDTDHVTDNQGCDQVDGCSKMLAKDNYMFSTFKDGRETMIERPGKPSVIRVYTDSADIIWTGLHDCRKGDVYQVRIENTKTGMWESQDFETNSGQIRRLQHGSTYVFKVRVVCSNGDESLFSEKSEEVTTHTSYASKIVSKSVLLAKGTNGPDLYRLPMKERKEARTTTSSKFDIGPIGNDMNEKTIMLFGATGTGKSTFVDAIANYMMGVKLEDTFRFTVMQEEERAKRQDQAVANTEIITCYSFNSDIGTVHSYRLNVVDTPGFGDMRGPERDEEIVKQIQQLFEAPGEKGIQMIDAICIFIKAPDSRLTVTETYIFTEIMSMFGNDIAGNMCMMITFNDGDSVPLVMASVRASGLPFVKEFTFNNLTFIGDPKGILTSFFGDKSLDNFSKMFKHLDTLESKSMHLTKDVLKERQIQTLTCQKLVISIKTGIYTIQSLNENINLLEQNEDDINRNKNYTYEVTEVRMVKRDLPSGIVVTNCLICNMLCHENCADGDGPRGCLAMDGQGYCTRCPKKCYWQMHKQTGYAYVSVEEKIQKTYDEIQKRYKEAKGKQLTLQKLVREKKKRLDEITAEIESMLDTVKNCNNRLKDMYLYPNPLSLTDQLDLMILEEEYERKKGFQKRIEDLKEFHERVAIDVLVQIFKTKESAVTVRYNTLETHWHIADLISATTKCLTDWIHAWF